MLDLKPAGAFADAAFAEDHDLFAAPQCINHDGPLFESDMHRGILAATRADVECSVRPRAERNAMRNSSWKSGEDSLATGAPRHPRRKRAAAFRRGCRG